MNALKYLKKALNALYSAFGRAQKDSTNIPTTGGIHKDHALTHLKKALNNTHADFHSGQWESIEALLQKKRIVVVQRTGWGKSMVYFLTTKLLREKGAGPTLLISPLLSLMRNQLQAAQNMGIQGRSINSTNYEDWESIKEELRRNEVDVLLISPERLAHEDFIQSVLAELAESIGLFVIDEAHCISDWGHDFRPDYRRIVRILQALPSNVPVLATTATANHRVIQDIQGQLGTALTIQRGTLIRKSLHLQNIIMPNPAARMAWLAQNIPHLPSSGIVYTLTQRDANQVSLWLQTNGIHAKAYHANIASATRETLEKELLANKVKVLVATVALGMGFDKPDLGFVIHFQRPASVVHYYQQVGRAGRAMDKAYGILLGGAEDDHIAQYFIEEAFPPQQHVINILNLLNQSEYGISMTQMQKRLNLRRKHIEKTVNFLTVESPSPIVKIGTQWHATAAAASYTVNQDYIYSIINMRYNEQQQMQEYMQESQCLMTFLQKALDDPFTTICGKCHSCMKAGVLSTSADAILIQKAQLFLQRAHQPIFPHQTWPTKNIFTYYSFAGYTIEKELLAEEGKALSLWRDAGWGQKVAEGKYTHKSFPQELVFACVTMYKQWAPRPKPTWVTCVPSLNHPRLVHDFAAQLAQALELPFVPCVEKLHPNNEQKYMKNSYQQAKNLDGVFSVKPTCLPAPCLLVDDVVSSGWTFTVVSALLRQAGCKAVYPLALALNSPKMG